MAQNFTIPFEELVQIGQDIASAKYYWMAAAAILFYDYFLTLGDEVQYAWKGKKSWVFVVFILNRYLSVIHVVWFAVVNHSWAYTQEMCNKTVFIEVLFFVWCTLAAQITLNGRLHAITLGNTFVTSLFFCIMISQLVLGVCVVVLVAGAQANVPPPIHLMAYHFCIFGGYRKMEIAYVAISLFYDIVAFSVVVFFTRSEARKGPGMTRIVRTIVRDATLYFLVIFTSHVVLVLNMLLARPTLQLLPAGGNNVILPVMIGRLILSLRRAADLPHGLSVMNTTSTSKLEPRMSKRRHALRLVPLSREDTVSPMEEGAQVAATTP